MTAYRNPFSAWQGFPPPAYVFSNLNFLGVAVEPPDTRPGSWTGAGKAVLDVSSRTFYLTARPRKVEGNVRGYAVNIYASPDGARFRLLHTLPREEIEEKSGLKIHSVEGTQLIRDPLTGRWFLYISVDTGPEFVWGGRFWETLLMTADSPEGPWEAHGIVLTHDTPVDACECRDVVVDVFDGLWLALIRSVDNYGNIRVQLAVGNDGLLWRKRGPLTIDGRETDAFLCNGSLFAGSLGPLFLGTARMPGPGHPSRPPLARWQRFFVAFRVDVEQVNLETLLLARWHARTPHEWEPYPINGYSTSLYDPFENRLLIYVDALGPESQGPDINERVVRTLAFECRL